MTEHSVKCEACAGSRSRKEVNSKWSGVLLLDFLSNRLGRLSGRDFDRLRD